VTPDMAPSLLPRPSRPSRIAQAIEYTRFPYTSSSNDNLIEEEGLLLRAADLIGQLGDPNYLKKANALFYEFEEIGLNKKLGYDTPADVVYKYPQFYWNNVAPQIQTSRRTSKHSWTVTKTETGGSSRCDSIEAASRRPHRTRDPIATDDETAACRKANSAKALLLRYKVDRSQEKMPKSLYAPCIPTRGTKVPHHSDWIHEVKQDGFRLILQRDAERVRLFTLTGQAATRELSKQRIARPSNSSSMEKLHC
jgi:hypothetical protein